MLISQGPLLSGRASDCSSLGRWFESARALRQHFVIAIVTVMDIATGIVIVIFTVIGFVIVIFIFIVIVIGIVSSVLSVHGDKCK